MKSLQILLKFVKSGDQKWPFIGYCLCFFLAMITSLIYGAGTFTSDAASWVGQWLGIVPHHDNFPAMVKVIFNLLTTQTGSMWHFNFLQNFLLYLATFKVLYFSLSLSKLSNKKTFFISLAFTIIFFFNPYILRHTSKWYIDYLFTAILLLGFSSFILALIKQSCKHTCIFIGLFLLAMSLRYNGPIIFPALFILAYG